MEANNRHLVHLSNTVLELRKSRNLTQRQMGSILHISSKTVSGYERGNIIPNTMILVAYAEYFNVDFNYIMGQENLPQPQGMLLSEAEKNLIQNLRKLPVHYQKEAEDLIQLSSEADAAKGNYEHREPAQPHMVSEKKGKY